MTKQLSITPSIPSFHEDLSKKIGFFSQIRLLAWWKHMVPAYESALTHPTHGIIKLQGNYVIIKKNYFSRKQSELTYPVIGTLTTLHLGTTQKVLDHRNLLFFSQELPPILLNNPTNVWSLSPKTSPRTINFNDHNGDPVRESDCPEVLSDSFSSILTNEPSYNIPNLPKECYDLITAITAKYLQTTPLPPLCKALTGPLRWKLTKMKVLPLFYIFINI